RKGSRDLRTPPSGEGPQAAASAEPFAEAKDPGAAPPPFPGEPPTGPTAPRPHSPPAPGPDTELRRTFPAFPPRESPSPQSLADFVMPLLPGPRYLDPHCSCPDRGHPCKHAAALCYQTARLLDAAPFVLLLLRGRGERELLDALSRLSATRAARAAQEQE